MTGEGGRTASKRIKQRAWFGTGTGPRPIKDTGFGAYGWG